MILVIRTVVVSKNTRDLILDQMDTVFSLHEGESDPE